jgi:hypothetical protein
MQSSLDIPLEKFSEDQINNIGHLAPQVFEPLLRPFRTQRVERQFSMRQTVKGALRTGSLLPRYANTPIPTRSARLVIAMSLSGIDRCYAVALIPLLLKLRNLLDFDIYIYTTDIVKAEISPQGFTNDYLLDWNHVYGPHVFSKLSNIMASYKGEAPELLIIDGGGGQASTWYSEWAQTESLASYSEYNKSMGPPTIATLRVQLQGDYTQWEHLASDSAREWIRKRIKTNSKRFVDCPALKPYLLRWLLHPSKVHRTPTDQLPAGYDHYQLNKAMLSLRQSCQAVHWLQVDGSYSYILSKLVSSRSIDYRHAAETLRDFSRVLTNICHHKCTGRISKPNTNIGQFQAKTESLDSETDDIEEIEWVPTSTKGRLVIPPYPTTPITAINQRYKGKGGIAKERQVPYAKLQPIWGYSSANEFTAALHSLIPTYLKGIPIDEAGDPNISNGSRIEIYAELRQRIATRPICFTSNVKHTAPAWGYRDIPYTPRTTHPALRLLHTSEVLQTPELFEATDDIFMNALQWLNTAYDEQCQEFPLYQLAWQTRGDFSPHHLSITFSPNQAATPTIYHELGHYIEHISPEVACCCAQFLAERLGEESITRKMYGNEIALVNPNRPWLQEYMGKVYPPVHRQLPPRTELLSMGFEYFRDPLSLCKLITGDRDLFNLMVFILSGGARNSLVAFMEFQEKRSFRPPKQPRSSSRGFRSRTTKQTSQGFGL